MYTYVYALMMESKKGCSITMQLQAICVVKSIESDSHLASYTSFMMDNINVTMYLKCFIYPYGYWPGS